MKALVYTANFGGYDNVYEPQKVNPDIDYIYYTDKDIKIPTIWRIDEDKPINKPKLEARLHKTINQLAANYNITIWVDAAFEILTDFSEEIEGFINSPYDLMTFKHRDRKTIEQESIAVNRLKNVPLNVLAKQIEYYRDRGYQNQVPLPESGLLFRKHNNRMERFSDLWAREVKERCIRDQMSFGYCAWRSAISVGFFPGNVRNNDMIIWHRHLKR